MPQWTEETPDWLKIALSVIGESRELVERIFVTKKVKKNGVYRLRLFKYGIENLVTIDDYIPFSTSNDEPIYGC